MTTQIRILHCLSGAAGQPFANSRAQRSLGYKSDCVLLGQSKFGYEADYFLDPNAEPFTEYSGFLKQVVDKYDVFHFYFRPFFLFNSTNIDFPSYLDLLLLKAAGKAVIFNYRGSEVRMAEKFTAFSPYNYVEENPNRIFSKWPTNVVEQTMKFVSAVADVVLVPDVELQSYVPHAKIVPRSVDLKKWKYIGPINSTKPVIVHAPSRQVVKGTHFVLEAISLLKAEGLEFEFRLVENMTNEDARRAYEDADIVIDQMRIGWYGVLAVEAMALGKAVISYVREDLRHTLPELLPLCIANPETLVTELRNLVKTYELRKSIGLAARRFVVDVHDAGKVNRQYLDHYHSAVAERKPVDFVGALNLLTLQKSRETQFVSIASVLIGKLGKYPALIGALRIVNRRLKKVPIVRSILAGVRKRI